MGSLLAESEITFIDGACGGKTSATWQYQVLLQHFIDVCKHEKAAAFATALSSLHFTELDIQSVDALVVTA